MAISIQDSKGSISEDRILQIEKDYNVVLPSQYKNFLTLHNGGYPEPDCFSFGENEDESLVERFLGVDCGEHSNLDQPLTESMPTY